MVLTTNSSGGVYASQGYYAYGRYRTGGTLPTDHKFTGQKLDGTGLYYYGARYYNPDASQFLSPDTLVPDPTNLFDYNRLMYVRGNPMGANDPTGHEGCPLADMDGPVLDTGTTPSINCAGGGGPPNGGFSSLGGYGGEGEEFVDPATAPGQETKASVTTVTNLTNPAEVTLSESGNASAATVSSQITGVQPVGGSQGYLKVHAVYADGTPVYEGQQPPRLGTAKPDPDAVGPHTQLRWDMNNQRVYQAREFDANGQPVRDIDFTNPTFPNGRVRPGHPGPPHQHPWIPNATGGTPRRSNAPEILE